jgi:hypothetical protein
MAASIFDKRSILKYVGNTSQLFGIKDYTFNGGKASGVRAMDFNNGSGLEFTVIADRAMDISNLAYKGANFSYISKTGVVAPQYYNERGIEFLRSFNAGFLTTCGLSNVGSPCCDDGEELGLHGRISHTPAEEVYAGMEWLEEGPVLKARGTMKEGRLFGENLVFKREIECKCGEPKFTIHDTVENYGFKEEPLMLLYHFNLGYPLLSENAYFEAPSAKVTPRDEEAAGGFSQYNKFQEPTHGYSEQVFYHDLKTDPENRTYASIANPDLNLALVIHFNKTQLPRLTQWKQMGEGEYVLGIEPCNCPVGGRVSARKEGALEFIKPGEIRNFDLAIEIVEGLPAGSFGIK